MNFRYLLLGLALVLLVIQFFRIDKDVPETDTAQDFIAMHNPPQEVQTALKVACYDCHSYQTVYPWYAEVSPISLWLGDHIDEGREHLNFSVWGSYSLKKQDHKLEESIEEVGEGEMPLESYTLVHGDAELSPEGRQALVDYFKQLRQQTSQALAN